MTAHNIFQKCKPHDPVQARWMNVHASLQGGAVKVMGKRPKHFPFLERFVLSHPILPWLKSASSELGMDLTTLGCPQLPCSSPALTQLPLPAPLAPRTPLTPSLKGVKGFDSSGRNTSYTSRWKMVTVCLFPSFVFACLLMRAELGGWERQQNREFSCP